MFVLCLLITLAIHAIHANASYQENGIRAVKDYVLEAELRKAPPFAERRIFMFKRNGVKIDVKVVPSPKRESTTKSDNEDYFPDFPVKDIGKCIIEFSLGCIRKRFVRFLETVGRLDEITLLGQDVKLVKNRLARSDGQSARNDSDVSVERSVDDLFDSFTLRITLPRWNSKRERNQIDVMVDETAAAEGRGKGGGGGGGKGGKGKGGKCKMMMMGMLMMIKMKLMGMMVLKGMMMGGTSLMLSMMMLKNKFGGGGGGGGPWQGGGGGGGGPWQGGGGGGGGGTLKEIVLLTKSSGGGGGGGGGGGCCGPSDSYGAPPPSSSYGVPSGGGGGGGGGYGGGGGWGRSFHKQPTILSYNNVDKPETASRPSYSPMIGEATLNTENVDYPDYQDYQPLPTIATSNSTASNWNVTNHTRPHEYEETNMNIDSMNNDSKVEATVAGNGRSFTFDGNPSTNVPDVIEKHTDFVNANQSDVAHDASAIRPIYTDEWQATAAKVISSNEPSSDNNLNTRVELQKIDTRVKDVPLLRGI